MKHILVDIIDNNLVITLLIALFYNDSSIKNFSTSNIHVAYFIEYFKIHILHEMIEGYSIPRNKIDTLNKMSDKICSNQTVVSLYRTLYDNLVIFIDIQDDRTVKETVTLNKKIKDDILCISVNRKYGFGGIIINKYLNMIPTWQFSSVICKRGKYFYCLFYDKGDHYVFDTTIVPSIAKVNMKDQHFKDIIIREASFIIYKIIH